MCEKAFNDCCCGQDCCYSEQSGTVYAYAFSAFGRVTLRIRVLASKIGIEVFMHSNVHST